MPSTTVFLKSLEVTRVTSVTRGAAAAPRCHTRMRLNAKAPQVAMFRAYSHQTAAAANDRNGCERSTAASAFDG